MQRDVDLADNVQVRNSAATIYLEAVSLYTVGVPEGHSTRWLCRPCKRLVSLMVTLLLCFG